MKGKNLERILNTLVIILLVVELLIVSIIIFQKASSHDMCGVDSCRIVQKSAYNNLFGMDVAILGLVGILVLILSFYKRFRRIYFWTLTIGVIIATYLIMVQLFILKKICPYCIVFDSLLILLYFLAILMAIIKNRK